ncbi:MAG: hypothetical protein ACI85I_000516 [Arenicella sp.]|jgi:hypothetical protein
MFNSVQVLTTKSIPKNEESQNLFMGFGFQTANIISNN